MILNMKKNQKIILSFDLDNTLIDNREGIINSFNYALNKYNLPEMNKNDIEKMIGIPLNDMFASVSKINPSLMCTAFREYYRQKGIYQSRLLDGVKNKLRYLKRKKFKLGIITSKKQEMAKKISEILKISNFFDYILGETEEINSKLDPKLKNLLLRMYPDYKFIVIGDHPKDALLSKNLNCPFIGVLTGFHSAEELKRQKTNRVLILKSVKEMTINDVLSFFQK